jgi:hypothetical protein
MMKLMPEEYRPEDFKLTKPTTVAFVVAALVVVAEAATIYVLTQSDDPFWPIAIFTTLVLAAFVLFLVYSVDAGLRDRRERRRTSAGL